MLRNSGFEIRRRSPRIPENRLREAALSPRIGVTVLRLETSLAFASRFLKRLASSRPSLRFGKATAGIGLPSRGSRAAKVWNWRAGSSRFVKSFAGIGNPLAQTRCSKFDEQKIGQRCAERTKAAAKIQALHLPKPEFETLGKCGNLGGRLTAFRSKRLSQAAGAPRREPARQPNFLFGRQARRAPGFSGTPLRNAKTRSRPANRRIARPEFRGPFPPRRAEEPKAVPRFSKAAPKVESLRARERKNPACQNFNPLSGRPSCALRGNS